MPMVPVSGALLLSNPRGRKATSRHGLRKHSRSHGRRKNAGASHRARSAPRTASGRFAKRRNLHIGTKHNRRRNGGWGAIAIRTNGIATVQRMNGIATRLSGIAVRMNPFSISTPANLVRMIPFVGPMIAPVVVPALVGSVAIGAVYYALEFGMPLVADYAPAFITDTVLPAIEPVGYLVGGVVIGGAIGMLPIPFVSPTTRKMIAVGAIVAGAAIDTLRWLSSDGAGASALGGGLEQVVDYKGVGRVFGDADTTALLQDYVDAKPGDASRCSSDMTPLECQAAVAGARSWRATFPPVRTLVGRGNSPISTHAGREGGQWGWCCRMIGFDAFRKLASLPADKRQQYIAQLRSQALDLLKQPQFSGLMVTQ